MTIADAEASARAADEAGIRDVLAAFTAAWNTHDAQAFAMAFAEDADFTNVRGMSAHGRAAIATFHAPVFATVFDESHQKIVDERIRFTRDGHLPSVTREDRRAMGNARYSRAAGATARAEFGPDAKSRRC